VVAFAYELSIAPNRIPIASPIILLQNPLQRIAIEQRQPHPLRLNSGAIDRFGETSTGRAEIFALTEHFIGQTALFASH
jgi:hypothetical protein